MLQTSGVIDLSDVNVELDLPETANLPMDRSDARVLAEKPVDDSQIKLSDFYGKASSAWANTKYPNPASHRTSVGMAISHNYDSSGNSYLFTPGNPNTTDLTTQERMVAIGALSAYEDTWLHQVFDGSDSTNEGWFYSWPYPNNSGGGPTFGSYRSTFQSWAREFYHRADASISGFRIRYKMENYCGHGGGCTNTGQYLGIGIFMTDAVQDEYEVSVGYNGLNVGSPPTYTTGPGVVATPLIAPNVTKVGTIGGTTSGGNTQAQTVTVEYILPNPVLLSQGSHLSGTPKHMILVYRTRNDNDYFDMNYLRITDVDFLVSGCEFLT